MSLPLVNALHSLVLAQAAGAPAGTFDLINMIKSIEGFGIVVAGSVAGWRLRSRP